MSINWLNSSLQKLTAALSAEIFMKWLIGLGITAICLGGVGYCRHYNKEGFKVMMADPPQTVVSKYATNRSYTCGNNCVANSTIYIFMSNTGATCSVSRSEFAQDVVGRKWKCMNLYGWNE